MEEDIAIIFTNLKRKYAYVYFKVEGNDYSLKIDKNELNVEKGIFNNEIYYVRVKGLKIQFPSLNTHQYVENLRGYWDALVDYGFEVAK